MRTLFAIGLAIALANPAQAAVCTLTMTGTTGTASGALLNGAAILGATSLTTDTGTGTIQAGEYITIAGVTGRYTVSGAVANVGAGSLTITPGLAGAAADNAAVTLHHKGCGSNGCQTGEVLTEANMNEIIAYATCAGVDGANCSSGQAPLGVDGANAAQSCFDVATQAELDAKSAASSTDNAICRFDGVTGDEQNSPCTIDDSGNITCPGTLTIGSGPSCERHRDTDDAGYTDCKWLNGVPTCEIDGNGVKCDGI